MKIEKHDRREKMDQIINHAVLSLDFWQDTVTYEGCAMPTGTIGCEVLNIPDSTIEKLDTPCNVLNQLLQGMNTGSVDMELLPQVQQAAGEIISFLQVTPPFSRLNRSYFEQKLAAIFSEEYMEDAKAYLQLTQQEQLICALTGQHSKATMLVRIAQVLGHLSYSLGQYKEALTKFAERLNEPGHDRTSDGYAAMFGQFLDVYKRQAVILGKPVNDLLHRAAGTHDVRLDFISQIGFHRKHLLLS